jgi:hypothetical protein
MHADASRLLMPDLEGAAADIRLSRIVGMAVVGGRPGNLCPAFLCILKSGPTSQNVADGRSGNWIFIGCSAPSDYRRQIVRARSDRPGLRPAPRACRVAACGRGGRDARRWARAISVGRQARAWGGSVRVGRGNRGSLSEGGWGRRLRRPQLCCAPARDSGGSLTLDPSHRGDSPFNPDRGGTLLATRR